jgi:hypothetical protein
MRGRLIEARARVVLRRPRLRGGYGWDAPIEVDGYHVWPDGRRIPIIGGAATGVSMTNYLENALLNEVLRNTAFAAITTIYGGLLTALADGEAQSWTEVSGGAYARQSIAFNAPDASGICSNTSDVLYPIATANWGTIVSFFLADAVSAGNGVIHGNLSSSKVINTNDQFVFRAGNLTVQFD